MPENGSKKRLLFDKSFNSESPSQQQAEDEVMSIFDIHRAELLEGGRQDSGRTIRKSTIKVRTQGVEGHGSEFSSFEASEGDSSLKQSP